MKILLSAFECNPSLGSDAYVGWSWTINLAKTNKVWVLVRKDHKSYIDRYLSENQIQNIDNIHFVYVRVSRFFGKVVYKFHHTLSVVGEYFIWQKEAYKKAEELHRQIQFDICHVVSMADFRFPGFLWRLNIPYIFGPVGGGQETPSGLKFYLQGHEKNENLRHFINCIFPMLPGYNKALRNAAKIYCSNDETQQIIERHVNPEDRYKIEHLCELCISSNYLIEREKETKLPNEIIHIMASGRLMYRKGFALLIDAIAKLQTTRKYVVDIYGDGEQRKELVEQVESEHLQDRVLFHGWMPYDEVQTMYKEADIFCLPSLRETTGTVVIEAMSNKLPVVALNQNGVKFLVENDAGILVNICDKERTIEGLANALKRLIEDDELRLNLGNNAFKKVKKYYTWEHRVGMMNAIYKDLVEYN